MNQIRYNPHFFNVNSSRNNDDEYSSQKAIYFRYRIKQ